MFLIATRSFSFETFQFQSIKFSFYSFLKIEKPTTLLTVDIFRVEFLSIIMFRNALFEKENIRHQNLM